MNHRQQFGTDCQRLSADLFGVYRLPGVEANDAYICPLPDGHRRHALPEHPVRGDKHRVSRFQEIGETRLHSQGTGARHECRKGALSGAVEAMKVGHHPVVEGEHLWIHVSPHRPLHRRRSPARWIGVGPGVSSSTSSLRLHVQLLRRPKENDRTSRWVWGERNTNPGSE